MLRTITLLSLHRLSLSQWKVTSLLTLSFCSFCLQIFHFLLLLYLHRQFRIILGLFWCSRIANQHTWWINLHDYCKYNTIFSYLLFVAYFLVVFFFTFSKCREIKMVAHKLSYVLIPSFSEQRDKELRECTHTHPQNKTHHGSFIWQFVLPVFVGDLWGPMIFTMVLAS